MTKQTLLVSGRVAGDPFPLVGDDGNGGQLITILAPEGSASRLWAAFLPPGQVLDQFLAPGDAVAIIGTLDTTRKSPGALNGPVTIGAILGLKADGTYFAH